MYGFNRTSWKQDDIKKVMADENMPTSKHIIRKIINNSGYKYRKAKIVLTVMILNIRKSSKN